MVMLDLPLLTECRKYLLDVLGVRMSEAVPSGLTAELPFFLTDAFKFVQIRLLEHDVVLAVDVRQDKAPLSQVSAWLTKAGDYARQPVVYVVGSLASYERRRLIQARLPFIVPGNQMFLPDLGVDLREHFRASAPVRREALSPSTQALLIWKLLNLPGEHLWNPTSVATELGYTAMTGSRALHELLAAGVGKKQPLGRSNYLVLPKSPRATWEAALPLLRSPVVRTVVTDAIPMEASQAGLSALSELSMLDGPRRPVFATRNGASMKHKHGPHLLADGDPSGFEIQVWSYSTELEPGHDQVDRLSLYLSLRDDNDERVQLALAEMWENMPW